ncbi:MAG TPA: hypothetical protein VMA55_19390, partial [Acidovorax sp.]|nr:hypothetical protein [Acidovorax sp.]
MDPVLGTALVGTAAYVSRETLNKLLGPTADYLGQGLRDISQKRIENIARIFRSAEQKAADSLEDG